MLLFRRGQSPEYNFLGCNNLFYTGWHCSGSNFPSGVPSQEGHLPEGKFLLKRSGISRVPIIRGWNLRVQLFLPFYMHTYVTMTSIITLKCSHRTKQNDLRYKPGSTPTKNLPHLSTVSFIARCWLSCARSKRYKGCHWYHIGGWRCHMCVSYFL